eukprot:TRINITY_DN40838_c0_g1_i1.p1 TRINITY_DN40838_c0_g1~~TRINITY_DN40838_c0_g1_i1.p1  ORF type:complete len:679 (+),score=102.52 TRINITY_DN40838_c0_g1_i1:65-2101(+)
MGVGVCCVQKRPEFGIDWINEAQGGPQIVSSEPRQSNPGRATCYGADDEFAEVAVQIATDRQKLVYEAAALIPVIYDVQPSSDDSPRHITMAVHRKTGVTRQLATFKKPLGVGAQERVRSYISSLQKASASSDAIAKVLECFEDYVNIYLVLEHCSGGTAYERILQRQYFTEQEASVLVRHMLQSLEVLHEHKLFHGCLSPESFCFLNDSPHSPLKLVDFGIELKAHRWDAVEQVNGSLELQNPPVPQFYETCKLVFAAPEVAPPHQAPRRRAQQSNPPPSTLLFDSVQTASGAGERPSMTSPTNDLLDGELLADVLDEHSEWLEEQQQDAYFDYHRKFEAADIWSVGAIAYLFLCGYPPFFAPSRNAILGRIHRGEVTYDPPFWSKISEDAKNFVTGCLLKSCWDRFSVLEALEHPWITTLADTSPSGCMFTSFMLNLRRFYRTSLVEAFVANLLASKLRREEMHEFLRRCKAVDMYGAGFFTASDLKHVLTAVGHGDVGEAITVKFLRIFRHPGESYIDYMALLDSIYLRQQRIFEEKLWRHFGRVCQSSCGGAEVEGWLSVGELSVILGDPVIVGLLTREITEQAGAEEATVCSWLESSIAEYCSACGTTQLEFHDLSALLLRFVRLYDSTRGSREALVTEASQSHSQEANPSVDLPPAGAEHTEASPTCGAAIL